MKPGMLKEYLVGLGFSVDDKTYNQAMGKMKVFEAAAGKMAGNVGKSVAKGSAIAVAALATVTVGVTKYVSSVAEADMATEKFARRMWMTETNARSLQNVLKAMGESMDSIYDVAANDELRGSFFQLRADAAKLEGGPEIDEAMMKIRNVQFEVQRLKLLLSYASRYIAYYLTQYLAVPMEQFRQMLKSINDDGQSLIKVWGDKVAKVLSWVVRLFAAGAQAGMSLIQMIQRLPYEVKVAMLAIAALGAIMLNPFTAIILAIGAILLLLDDFYTWQRGGESMFGDMWQKISDSVDEFKAKFAGQDFESPALDMLMWMLDTVKGKIGDVKAEWDKLKLDFSNFDAPEWLKTFMSGAAVFAPKSNDNGSTTEQQPSSKGIIGLGSFLERTGNTFSNSLGKVKENINVNVPKMSLPAMANPTVSKAMSTLVKHNNDVKIDNSLTQTNNFTVNGTDAGSIATATASEIEAIMRRNMTSWQNARIKTIPKG
jgi:hypothetical protein